MSKKQKTVKIGNVETMTVAELENVQAEIGIILSSTKEGSVEFEKLESQLGEVLAQLDILTDSEQEFSKYCYDITSSNGADTHGLTFETVNQSLSSLNVNPNRPVTREITFDHLQGGQYNYGFSMPLITVYEGTIIQGHNTRALLLSCGLTTAMVKVYDALTDEQFKAMSNDQETLNNTKLDLYSVMLYADNLASYIADNISKVMSLIKPAKDSEMSTYHGFSVTKKESDKAKLSKVIGGDCIADIATQRLANALLATRFTGVKQNLTAVKAVPEEYHELLGYGLHARTKSLLNKLPAECCSCTDNSKLKLGDFDFNNPAMADALTDSPDFITVSDQVEIDKVADSQTAVIEEQAVININQATIDTATIEVLRQALTKLNKLQPLQTRASLGITK